MNKSSKLDPLAERPNLDFSEGVRGKHDDRKQERGFTKVATAACSPAFEAIWNNPEDASYNALSVQAIMDI